MEDAPPDLGAPRPVLDPPDRRRLTVLTLGTVAIAVGVVLAISTALPAIPAWGLPSVLLLLTAAFLAVARRFARRGATFAARAWAGWAGLTIAFALLGGGNLLGFGGALTATLLVVLALNAAIALWFRSGVHFAVVQVLGFGWGVLAHVYGIPPWASVVLAVAGLWWLGAVRVTRIVAVVTTLTIPLSVALLVHPFTHRGPAIDGADIALVAGLTSLAVLIPGVVTRRAAPGDLWPVVRRTAFVATVVQVAAGAVPSVGTVLAPAEPWPGLLAGTACALAAVAVWGARRTRPGVLGILLVSFGLIAVIGGAVVGGQFVASVVSCSVLGIVLVVAIVRAHLAAVGGVTGACAWAGLLGLAVFAVTVTGASVAVTAAVLVVVGLLVVAVHARRGVA